MEKIKKKFIAIIGAVAGALLALMTVITCVMYSMREYMDQFLGTGKSHTVSSSDLEADYIDYECNSKEEALKLAQDMTQKTAEEGIVLLKNKNNALPLASSEKLTLLGYYGWHNNMSGGEDPATTSGAISLHKGIEAAFTTNPNVNSTNVYAKSELKEGEVVSTLDAQKTSFAEYKTAIITLKRNSGEGNDQVMDSGAAENNRTGLTANRAEMKLIDYACKNFEKVILIINAANTMELGFLDENDPNMKDGIYTDPYSGEKYDVSKIYGAFWAGCCGSQGGKAMANILKGTVNPSGHTPDIYARTLRNDPSYVNFSDFKYDNSASLDSYAASTYFVEYEEGIYIGYRYHETAAKEAAKGNYAGYDYDKAVVYPFGYGLSYTTYSHEYAETPTYDSATQTYNFKVKVTNTGNKAGMGVAQIYVNVPWQQGQVEKAHVVLGGFAKTKELAPGASDTVNVEIKRDYFTSYDYTGEKAYVLDAGDYNFYLASDELGSHSWAAIDEMSATDKAKVLWTDTLDKKIVFNAKGAGKRLTDEKIATNVMDDETNYKFKKYGDGSTGDGFIHDFTRANFKDSFPTAPVGNDKILSDSRALKQVAVYDVWDSAEQNGVDQNGNAIKDMPEVDTDKTSYALSDMRGVDFDDPKWDDYIDQFTVDSMAYMFSNGGWQAPADVENGVPKTWDTDSPYGYYGHSLTINGVNKWYCGAPMVAATFNVELAKELGEAFGEEAWQQKQTDGAPITGLYGFGMNQHRSAFGGRNYEYYSEDPVLCGKIGMAEASGASGKGLIVYMKHYVMNDQEYHRQDNGYCAWVNEQAFREVYLRAWEIYMKEAKMTVKYYAVDEESGEYKMAEKEMTAATGIMTCYNRIGATYGGASVSINGILRSEWKFTGTVLTDAGGEPDTYMTTDLALRRGQNLTLSNNGTQGLYDTESKTAVWWLKQSTRHLLYNKANSNILVGLAPGDYVYYDMSPWQIGIIVGWVIVGLLAAGAVVVCVLAAKDVIKLKEKQKTVSEEEDY